MMNNTALEIFQVIQVVLLILLGLPTFYILAFAVAGLFYRQKPYPDSFLNRKIAVLIPGYREDDVIVEVAAESLKQDYPAEFYDIVIIADSFRTETLNKLRLLKIKVIEVSFDKSTKAKALNRAMENLDNRYDIAVVLDADNLMAHDFLSKVNRAFEKNIIALQGHRTAKNLNTPLAILDAASEEINNHIFRKGHRAIGLSSAIIGSGMAFRYGFFKEMMKDIRAIGGFDKEIELKMLREGHTIEYLDDALVLDEKVQVEEVFTNQRRRWLAAQIHYFRTDILPAFRDLLIKGNADYFDKAIQFIQPPRVLLLGAVLVLGLFFVSADLISGTQLPFVLVWTGIMTACILAFLFSLPLSFYNMTTLGAVMRLPKGFILMFRSLLKIRGANKSFLHTRHSASPVQNKN
jgi:cellulose synthase/poly-beta-1,6-N-acetylglucosamine synthase-like glycosyltransferase